MHLTRTCRYLTSRSRISKFTHPGLISIARSQCLPVRRHSSDCNCLVTSLDRIEVVADYRIGGFYPVNIGDALKNGRYQVLHKLGYGTSCTVWLARDQEIKSSVSLKILTADASKRCQPRNTSNIAAFLSGGKVAFSDEFSASSINGI